VIRVVYKMRDHDDNSGVFIRIPIEPREAWMPVNYGYEVQIDNDPGNEDDTHITGMLYSLTVASRENRQARSGVEHNGDHTGWSANDRRFEWREGLGI